MAGNSKRRGAVRKAPKHTAGSGGRVRQGLEGRGPTPKAEDREYHAAHKRKAAAETRAATSRPGSSSGAAPRRPARRSTTHEIVAGRNSVLEAMRAGVPVTTVYVAARIEHDDRTREILKLAADAHRPLLEVGRLELDRMTDGAVHQGVAIQVPPYAYAEPDDLLDTAAAAGRPALVVALDGVTDPRNLGAVLRSAGAFGADGVLVPERRAAGVTASAWKVSAGAAARVPVARATNLARALAEYRKAGVFVVGLDGHGDTTVGELPFAADPLVLVVGSEGKGLSRLVREQCDAIAAIPIAGEVESLNAGVAAGIALYEVARRRAE
ncbi:MAG: 23S rRNA (guanosine(2251)-2'-O)-methyltransferase RlmB [Cellulomonas sp.]|uniref:23S rRNA (guanosine(2251)-2'-O)-methyltransferase RlmB n=1 Tax=Cellulomonas sp. 73-92 TaxID=1895740 RepID=UPI0009292B6D|nr:23S rRNA (guanosine(2251)-2'-O)-methyltransferase RlmB [Cellulomonas sp. 73-92]MBN9375848.1 23S rRNA (guanosine(2251)-2'-O)-methyltransferase RlmB [Cellulomonas sp.]OJV81265.1 MAG: 23S rRNA (guanosine(2251)-2'-O)-methyltransferase RlmB [Cellulomonas sp. 73-92]